VGTKTGEIEMFDVASSQLIETVNAHEGAIWSLQVHPDGKSLVTSSADKSAKFWNFEIVQEDIPGTKVRIRFLPTLSDAADSFGRELSLN
jgi:U3 small nucleolar RNA-associated protein 12